MLIKDRIRKRAYREARKIVSPERVQEVAETMIRRASKVYDQAPEAEKEVLCRAL